MLKTVASLKGGDIMKKLLLVTVVAAVLTTAALATSIAASKSEDAEKIQVAYDPGSGGR